MLAPPFRIRVSAGFKAIILADRILVNSFPKDLHSTKVLDKLRPQWARRTAFFPMCAPMNCPRCRIAAVSRSVAMHMPTRQRNIVVIIEALKIIVVPSFHVPVFSWTEAIICIHPALVKSADERFTFDGAALQTIWNGG